MSVAKKYAQANGDTVIWTIDIENPTNFLCRDVKVVFTIPDGITLSGPSDEGYDEILVPQGAYDRSTDTWWVGILETAAKRSVDLEFTVDDISKADTLTGYFELKAVLSSGCNAQTSTSELVIAIGNGCDDGDLKIGAGTESSIDISIG